MKLFMKNKIKFLAVSILSVFVFSACSQLIPPSSEPEKISYIEDGTVSVVGNISFSDKGRSAVTTGDFINAKYKFLISFVRDATDVAPAKTYDIYRTDRTSFNQTFEYGKYTVSVKVKDENGKDVVTYEPTIDFNGIDYYTDQFIISKDTIKTDGKDNTLKIIISPDTTCDGTGKISLPVYTT